MRCVLALALLAASRRVAGDCAVNLAKFGGLRYTIWKVNNALLNDEGDKQLLGGGEWTSGLGIDKFDLAKGCYGMETYSTLGKDAQGGDPTLVYYNVTSPEGCMEPAYVTGNGFSSGYFSVDGAFCNLPECYGSCYLDTTLESTDFCDNYQTLLSGSCTKCTALLGQTRQMQLRCLQQGCAAKTDCMVADPTTVTKTYVLDVHLLIQHTRIGDPMYNYALKRLVEQAVAKVAKVDTDIVFMTMINGKSVIDVVENTLQALRGAAKEEDPWSAFDLTMTFATQAEADAAAANLKAGMDELTRLLQSTGAKVGLGDAEVVSIDTKITEVDTLPEITDDSTDGDWPGEDGKWNITSSDSAVDDDATASSDDDCAADSTCTCEEGDEKCEQAKKELNGTDGSSSSSSGGMNQMMLIGIAVGGCLAAAIIVGVGYGQVKKRRARAAALQAAKKAKAKAAKPSLT